MKPDTLFHPQTEAYSVSLFPDLADRLRLDAAERRVSFSSHLRDALGAYYAAVARGRIPALPSYWTDASESEGVAEGRGSTACHGGPGR